MLAIRRQAPGPRSNNTAPQLNRLPDRRRLYGFLCPVPSRRNQSERGLCGARTGAFPAAGLKAQSLLPRVARQHDLLHLPRPSRYGFSRPGRVPRTVPAMPSAGYIPGLPYAALRRLRAVSYACGRVDGRHIFSRSLDPSAGARCAHQLDRPTVGSSHGAQNSSTFSLHNRSFDILSLKPIHRAGHCRTHGSHRT